MEYDQSRRVYEESEDTRTRTPADTRRFQSLATVTRHDGKKTITQDEVEQARKRAEERAFEFPPFHAHSREFAKSNSNEDGNEMFHDLLDVLYVVQPPHKIWIAPVLRARFCHLARELHRGEPLSS